MILVDHQIREAVLKGELKIINFDEACLGPASYGLRIGRFAYQIRDSQRIDLAEGNGQYLIPARESVLVETYESLELSRKFVGRLGLTPRLTREGFFAQTSLQVDPGFRGYLSVSLLNLSPKAHTIRFRERFLSIEFQSLDEEPRNPSYETGFSLSETLLTENETIVTPRIAVEPKRVELVPASSELLALLREDIQHIYQITPDKFELLICDRLSAMGFEVERVGSIYTRDGGVDIVAWPPAPTPFPYLLAVQAKHHRSRRKKTGPEAVRAFHAVVSTHPFQAGLFITNTTFTPDARWFATNRQHILRLRDLQDLKRWIAGNFLDEAEWKEIPPFIELAPGFKIFVPR